MEWNITVYIGHNERYSTEVWQCDIRILQPFLANVLLISGQIWPTLNSYLELTDWLKMETFGQRWVTGNKRWNSCIQVWSWSTFMILPELEVMYLSKIFGIFYKNLTSEKQSMLATLFLMVEAKFWIGKALRLFLKNYQRSHIDKDKNNFVKVILGPHFLCWILGVVPFNTWLISWWEENNCCYKLSNWLFFDLFVL